MGKSETLSLLGEPSLDSMEYFICFIRSSVYSFPIRLATDLKTSSKQTRSCVWMSLWHSISQNHISSYLDHTSRCDLPVGITLYLKWSYVLLSDRLRTVLACQIVRDKSSPAPHCNWMITSCPCFGVKEEEELFLTHNTGTSYGLRGLAHGV